MSELFPIARTDKGGAFQPTTPSFLQRMRTCTLVRQLGFDVHAPKATALDAAPFRCFAFPGDGATRWIAALRDRCIARSDMDVLFIDLTRRGREALGVSWASALGRFLGHVDQYLQRHMPRVMVVTDSPFVAKTALDVLENRPAAKRRGTTWPHARLCGVLAQSPELVGGHDLPMPGVEPFQTTTVLRDPTMTAFRDATLALAHRAEEGGDECRPLAAAIRRAYDFVRRAAGLPCGINVAKRVLLRDHATRREDIDSLDPRLRHKYFPDEMLADLARQSRQNPILSESVNQFRGVVEGYLAQFATASALSKDIVRTLDTLCHKSTRSALVLPTAEAVDFLVASLSLTPEGRTTLERADGKVLITDRSGVKAAIEQAHSPYPVRRIVLVQPRPEEIRKLVLMPDPCRVEVSLIGDVAGIGLVAAELATLLNVPGLERIRERVRALLAVIDDEQNRIAHLDFDASAVPPLAKALLIDLTRDESEASPYTGPVREIAVDSGYGLRYRPTSEVLRHTGDENRPFVRAPASEIDKGDRILVLTPALMDRLRLRFLRRGEPSDMLGLYHRLVAEARTRLPGRDLSEKARGVLDTLVRECSAKEKGGFTQEDFGNVRRWLSVDPADGGVPRAPRHYHRYCAFMKAIGVMDVLVKDIWLLGIRDVRSCHISEGLAFNKRCVAFLVEPDTMAARAGLSSDEVDALWCAVLGEVATVTEVHTRPSSSAAT